MKEALSPSETSVLTRATRPNIPEDTILRLQLLFVKKHKLLILHPVHVGRFASVSEAYVTSIFKVETIMTSGIGIPL
jgi:hypothetical protein